MLLKFLLRFKEYYGDESIRDVYRNVLERLILAFYDDDHENSAMSGTPRGDFVLNENNDDPWPRLPWPPWGPDKPNDRDRVPHVNKSEKAYSLSKRVLKLETQIANASLDL
jgi:endothelin-converting enzyme